MNEEADPKIEAAIGKLSGYGFDLIDDPEAMKVLFDWNQLPIPPLTVAVGGIDDGFAEPNEKHRFEAPPMVIQIRHDESKNLIFEHDPIGFVIEGSLDAGGEHVYCDITLARVQRSIAAMQNGIDRLKAHEALLLSLQP